MGWWSCTVMGGDEPLDDLGVYGDVLGIKFDIDKEPNLHGYTFTRKMVEASIDKLVDAAGNDAVMWQVLGVILMWAGAGFSDEIRREIINAAHADPWVNEVGWQSERGGHLEAFIKTVEEYKPGVCVEVQYESLWDGLAAKLGG